jgi:hypothetical protein
VDFTGEFVRVIEFVIMLYKHSTISFKKIVPQRSKLDESPSVYGRVYLLGYYRQQRFLGRDNAKPVLQSIKLPDPKANRTKGSAYQRDVWEG